MHRPPQPLPHAGSTRAWLETHMTAVTIVILVLLGAFFPGEGLGILG
ncbi:hypothetical protein [Brachybacterium sp. HMSC06H03]|nr:hypothetical protein [Brachybacterium sp. HMSC06H03]